MPTSITLPTGDRTKSIQFGAPYSPSLSFNPDKDLLVGGCAGTLTGLGLTVNTVPTPNQVTVAPGSFIQNGIIVNVTNSEIVEVPSPVTYPLYLVAENTNEVFSSAVQYLFTNTPAMNSVILGTWLTGPITAPEIPIPISNCGLLNQILEMGFLTIRKDRQTATGGQTVFTTAGQNAWVVGTHQLFVYRNGKKLDSTSEYTENSTTQFTLANAASNGDIIDIIVFQGTPPLNSFGLANLIDVSLNLANAIKDTSNLRAAPATAANPLATLQDITANTGLNGANYIIEALELGSQQVPQADYFQAPGGLTFRLLASSTNPFAYYVNGTFVKLTANVNLTVTNNAHNFVWIDNTGTLGSSAFPCFYNFVAPGAPATDQHWFDLSTNTMKRWNGASWAAVTRIFIGYCRADSGAINPTFACDMIGLTPLERFRAFGPGNLGFLDLSSGVTPISGQGTYSAIVLRGTASVVPTAFPAPPLILMSQSVFVVADTANVNTSGYGAPGGLAGANPGAPGGFGGAGGGGGNGGGNGGARVNYATPTPVGAGTAGIPGFAGSNGQASEFNVPLLRDRCFRWLSGAGGGGGGTGPGGVGGAAGAGMVLMGAFIIIGTGGAYISATGAAGTTNDAGGGGGGVIILICGSISYGSILTNGGAGSNISFHGGNGGNGVSVLELL